MSQFTQTLILDTFGQLLEEMPYEKLSASAVIRRCGINHNTFYYHFHNLEHLLDEWLLREVAHCLPEDGSVSLEDGVQALLHACRIHRRSVAHLVNSLSGDELRRCVGLCFDARIEHAVREALRGSRKTEDEVQRITDFCRFAFAGFFLRYVRGGMEADVGEEVHELAVLFRAFVAQARS